MSLWTIKRVIKQGPSTLFENSTDIIVSQIQATIVSPEQIAENYIPKPKPEVEPWDCTPSPKWNHVRYTLFDTLVNMSDHEEGNHERINEEEWEERTEATFGFPILNLTQYVNMKNIPPPSLPNFYGKALKIQKPFGLNLTFCVEATIM